MEERESGEMEERQTGIKGKRERVRISLLFSEIGWEVFSDAHLLESVEVEHKSCLAASMSMNVQKKGESQLENIFSLTSTKGYFQCGSKLF